ncbi:MAG TPA: hypothetical protein VF961_07345, partial [Pyrinomonadaceae bacterium]
DIPLPSKPIWMRYIIGIHARHKRRMRFGYYGVRTAGQSESIFAFMKVYTLIVERPFPYESNGSVRRCIVENYELKVAQSLRENALNAFVKEWKRVVHGHYNANRRIRHQVETRE